MSIGYSVVTRRRVTRALSTCFVLLASTIVFAASAQAQVSGLVAAYGFNETSGSTTTDASGSNNTGTFGSGVTRTASGRFGGGLVFNGTTGRVTIPNSSSLTLTTGMTLEAWVNPTVVNSNWRDVIYKASDIYYLMATSTTSSRPAGGGTFSGGTGTTKATGSSAIAVNTWTHLAVTYDGANIRLYVNGTQVSSVARTGSLSASTNALTIGSDAIFGQGFSGTIDEVRVYNRALSAAQVQTDMNTAVNTGPDTTAPTVSITSPTSGPTFSTNATSVTLSGTAADNVGVTQVSWVNDRGGSGNATGTTSWSASGIALQPGANVLTVTARDAAGNTANAVLTVTSDPTPPTVAITSPTGGSTFTTATSPISLGGTAGDNVGVTQVSWANNRGGSGNATGTTSWSVSSVALQAGDNVLTVTARDAVGNTASATLTVTYTPPDNTPPTVSITSPTSSATYSTNSTSITVGGSASDNVGVTQVSWTNSAGGSGNATGTTSWTAAGIALQPGTNVITVTARDAANNPATATLTVTQDAVAPSVNITAPAAGATVSGAVLLTASASDNVGTVGVQFLLDGAALGSEVLGAGPNYSGSWTTNGVSNGTHTLSAQVRDAAGNTALAPTVSVTVSNSGPAGLVAAYGFNEISGSTTTDASGSNNTGTLGTGVTRTASGRFGGALSFNGSGMVTIPNAASLGLTTGMTLEAWVNPSIVDGNWRDVIYKGNDNYYLMGMTTNSSRPAGGGIFGGGPGTTQAFGTTSIPSNTWTHLAVTYDGANLRLYVNGVQASSVARTGAITTSTNPLTIGSDPIYGQGFVGLIDEVRVYGRALSAAEVQTDMGTAVGGSGADVTAPTVSITGPTSAPTFATNATSLTLSGVAADNVGVTQVSWVNDRGGSGNAAGTTSWSASGVALLAGTNVLTVTARDGAGNTATAVLTVTSDPTPPTVAITSPTSAATFVTTATPISLGGSAGDNVGVTQVSWVNNRGGSGNATGTTGWSVASVALQPGDNVLTVTARDAVGNLATATLTVTYNVPDNTPPTVAITAPTTSPTFATNATSLTISGTAADNVGVTQVSWVNDRGGSGNATGTTSWSVSGIALQPGTNVLTVTAVDAANNPATATLTVTSDPTAPTVAITTPTGSATFSTTSTPLALAGTAADNIGVTQVSWVNNRGGSGNATGTTSWSVASVALQSGDNVLTVTARDAVGNTATATLTVTYTAADNTAPTIAITSPTSAATFGTNLATISVGGSAADNVGVTQVTWTNSAGGSGNATGTTSWTAAGIALQPGTNVITVTAVDAANNPATATLTITQDAVAPAVTITAPGAGATLSGATTLTASASDNVGTVGVQFLLDGAALGTEVLGAGPNYSASWTTTGVSNGPHTLSAQVRDAAGNTALAPNVSVTISNVPTGLVAAFGFEETSGSTTADVSGLNNTGTLGSGVTRTSGGRFGGALAFNGTSGKVTVANAASLQLTTAMTLEAWVNPSLVNSNWRDVIYKGNDNYFLMATTTNSSRPAGGGTLGSGSIEAFGTSAIPVNTWTHLAMTYDGATIRQYVNGVLSSSVARTGAIATSTNPLTIGGDPIFGQFFQGMIDEVRVYSRALSATEVQNDMNTAIGNGGPVDTQAPTVAITAPSGTGSYTATSSPLTVSGTAADDIGVTQVTWVSDRGGSGAATGTTAWSVSGIVLQPGVNVITVTARDAANNTGTATLTVTYNVADVTAPTVTITGPTSGATYSTNLSAITVSGTGADNVGVTQVTWTNSAGGSGNATGTTNWSASAIALQPGTNVITVTAVDAAANSSTATLTVSQDAIVPTVTLTAPGAGATVTGTTTTITASAADNIGTVGVQMLLDGAALGAEVLGTGPTYNFTWNTTSASNGSHTLSARVRDAAGNTGLAPNVSVTVSNAAPAGLVAAYGFEEGGGTTVLDASGNNNNATLVAGVVRNPNGRLGAAVTFNGSSKLTIPNSPSLQLTTAMTLEAWVNPVLIDGNWRDAIYKGQDNYYLEANTSNTRPAGGGTFGSAGTSTAFGTSSLATNTWTHIAVTYDGAALRFYVNGTQVSSVAKTGAIATSTNPLEIGGDAIFQQYFQGTIDEVRIYNRALSVAEISTDMTTPVTDPAPPPPLSQVGQWSAPFDWPIVSIHAALLKTGEVLSWEYNGAGGPYLWNPITGQFTAVPPTTGSNLFCAGEGALSDGRFLIAGGHIDVHVGINELNIFDPVTRSWTSAPPMAQGRWYPTVTGLPDGRSMIMSGETTCDGCNALIPELYDPVANTVAKLSGASANFTYYPHMYVLPDGRVLAAASAEAPVVTKVLDLTTQTWSVVDPTAVDGGSSVMYLPGKIMKTGTSHNPDLPPDPSSPNTYVLDMTQASPHWQATAPMANARTYHTTALLPDGNVLVTGGGTTSDAVAIPTAVYAAELWSPATQTWSTLSSSQIPRLYHSVALLLPDARVLVAGGGRFNGFPSNDVSERLNAEIFSPGYLFRSARPTITSAPASAGYGATITVQTPDAANIQSVSLIRLASVTHAFNADQRFLPLSFTPGAGSLDITMPANVNLAPPGYYMLFILNADGVPSVAKIVQMK